MTRAVLLLTGGRGLPDMLFVKYMIEYWHPDFICTITTAQGRNDAENLKDFAQRHFHCIIEVLPIIDPFNEEQVKARCEEAFSSQADAEWICHFTSAPKGVGIYAYEVAQKHKAAYYFLDTGGRQVLSFVKKDEWIDVQKLYKATVKEYMGAYGRACNSHRGLAYQSNAEAWYPVADALVQDFEATQALLVGLRKAQNATPSHSLTPVISTKARHLLKILQEHGFLVIEREVGDEIQCTIVGSDQCQFLTGDWLEVYAWHQARQTDFADDYQWGLSIRLEKKLADIIPSNELDVLLTYRAKLLIAECKTSIDPFDSSYLDKLYAISNLVGMGYVSQVFITNRPKPRSRTRRFDSFCKQAAVRNIKVITGEQLPEIGKLLKEAVADSNRK